jgi:hypothetical protein
MRYLASTCGLALAALLAGCGDGAAPFDAGHAGADAVSADGPAADGAAGGDAALADGAPGDASGVLGFMEECDPENDLCDGTLDPPLFCWNYPNRGPHCTHECDLNEECAPPSPGCNQQGVCRAP